MSPAARAEWSAGCRRAAVLGWAAATLAFAWQGELPWAPLAQHAAPASEPPRADGATDAHRAGSAGRVAELGLDAAPQGKHHKRKGLLSELVAGMFLAGFSFALLWVNEAHAARMDQLLTFAKRRLKEVSASAPRADDLRELVHAAGVSASGQTLRLEDWGGLTAPANSAKLCAVAYMQQWEEEHLKDSVKYNKIWCSQRIASERFQCNGSNTNVNDRHDNPAFQVPHTQLELAEVRMGDFLFSHKMLGKMQPYKDCPVTQEDIERMNESPMLSEYAEGRVADRIPDFPKNRRMIYFPCKDVTDGIGDVAVRFEYVACGPMTIVGVQVPAAEYLSRDGKVLVPGCRVRAGGSPGEIVEVTGPPRPVLVRFTEDPQRKQERFEIEDVHPERNPTPWQIGAGEWTLAPLQFATKRGLRPKVARANTATTNLGDAAHQTLLGENERDDYYVEDEDDAASHIFSGIERAMKVMSSGSLAMADAFVAQEEVCLVLQGELTAAQALRWETRHECAISSATRLFGFFTMWISFLLILSPLRLLCSFFWVLGAFVWSLALVGTCLCAASCSALTVGTAWLTYRPLYGILVILSPLAVLAYLHAAAPPGWAGVQRH